MKIKIDRTMLIQPLTDSCESSYSHIGRTFYDNEQKNFKGHKSSITNGYTADLGEDVGVTESSAPTEDAGDGDDGDTGDGDPEPHRRNSNSYQHSYIYKNSQLYQLPNEGFVRLRHILQVLPIGKSTWWAGVKSGRYPKPVRTLGQRITAWRVEDIRSIIQNAN